MAAFCLNGRSKKAPRGFRHVAQQRCRDATSAHQKETGLLACVAEQARRRSGRLIEIDDRECHRWLRGWMLRVGVSPVHTVIRNCTRDEGGPFEIGNQVLISSHRKLLSSKAMVVTLRKRRDTIPSGKVERGERKQTADDVSKRV